MTKHAFPTDCPCGSGQNYKDCCFMYHMEKVHAPTAEALMRSRYSAYALRKSDYVLFSWHASTRPSELDLSDDKTKWMGLTILSSSGGSANDDEGMVEFAAKYKIGGRAAKLVEKSRFVREKGRWYYVDGEVAE
jgi:SEC-C motif-containing protein